MLKFRKVKIPFFDIDNWKEIGATLARNKTRTFLTAFGIFWGVFMLACLMGGARGAEDLLRRNFAGFATNSAILFPGKTTIPYQGHAKGRRWSLDMTDLERLQVLLPQLKTVTPQSSSSNISFRNGRYTYSGQIWGVRAGFTDVMTPAIESGRFINDADERFMRKVAVVGKKVANELFPGVTDPVGREILVNGVAYRIVGIAYQNNEIQMGDRIDNVVIMPLKTFQNAFNKGDLIDGIMMVGYDTADFTALEPKIRRILYSRHKVAPDDTSAMWYMNISEEFAKVDALFMGVSFLALFIGLSTLIAGIIGIGNIMWVIVKERTRKRNPQGQRSAPLRHHRPDTVRRSDPDGHRRYGGDLACLCGAGSDRGDDRQRNFHSAFSDESRPCGNDYGYLRGTGDPGRTDTGHQGNENKAHRGSQRQITITAAYIFRTYEKVFQNPDVDYHRRHFRRHLCLPFP